MRGPQNKLHQKVYTFLIKAPIELPIKKFFICKNSYKRYNCGYSNDIANKDSAKKSVLKFYKFYSELRRRAEINFKVRKEDTMGTHSKNSSA